MDVGKNGNGHERARPNRVSTEVELASQLHSQSIANLHKMLDEELARGCLIDGLLSAMKNVISKHHTAESSSTLCSECSNLYYYINQLEGRK